MEIWGGGLRNLGGEKMEIWGSLRSFGAKTGGFWGVKMGYFGGSSQFWGACVAFCCLQHFGVNSEDFGVPRRFGVNLPDFGVRPFGAESPKISPSFGSPTILGILQYFGVKVGDFGVLRNFGVDFEGFGVPQHSGVNSWDLGGGSPIFWGRICRILGFLSNLG